MSQGESRRFVKGRSSPIWTYTSKNTRRERSPSRSWFAGTAHTQDETPLDLEGETQDLDPGEGDHATVQRVRQERQERNPRRGFGPRKCFKCGSESHLSVNAPTRDVLSVTHRHTVRITVLAGEQEPKDDGEGQEPHLGLEYYKFRQ